MRTPGIQQLSYSSNLHATCSTDRSSQKIHSNSSSGSTLGKARNVSTDMTGVSKDVKNRVDDIKKQLDAPVRRNTGFSRNSPEKQGLARTRKQDAKSKLDKLLNFSTPYDGVVLP